VGLLKKGVAALLVLPVFMSAMILLHEGGHAGTARLLAGIECEIYVWPGVEIYPDFGKEQLAPWNSKSLALTKVVPPANAAVLQQVMDYNNVILFMGSGFTQLLSLLALVVITLVRPKGILLWLLAPCALLHLDMLSYTVFPLLHLRHLLLWGGSHSETLIALGAAGIPQYVSVPVIVLLSLGQFYWLYRLLRSPRPFDDQHNLSPVSRYPSVRRLF
jgi:hypothetical protein